MNRLSGVLSQLLFAGNSILLGIYAALYFSPDAVASIAIVSVSSMFAATIINAMALTPYSLLIPKHLDSKRRRHIEIIYTTYILLAIAASGIVLAFMYAILLPSFFLISGLFYSATLIFRHQQRIGLLARGSGFKALYAEAAIFLLTAAIILSSSIGGLRPSATILLTCLAVASFPLLIAMQLWDSEVRLQFVWHRAVWSHWKRIWRRIGIYAVPGIVLSEALLSGHIYLLSVLENPVLIAELYIASLIFRPVAVLVVGLNSTMRPVYVRWIHDRNGRAVSRSVGAIAVSVTVCVLAIGGAAVWSMSLFGIDYLHGSYSEDGLRATIIVSTLFYMLQTARLPFTTALQALWDFRFNLWSLAASLTVATSLASLGMIFSDDRHAAFALMLSGQMAFTSIAVLRYFAITRDKPAFSASKNKGS